MEALEELTEVDRPLRMANLARLLELRRDHAGTVEIFSAHALGRPAVPVQLWEPG